MTGARSDGLTRSALKRGEFLIVGDAQWRGGNMIVMRVARRSGSGPQVGGGTRERVIRNQSIPARSGPAAISILQDRAARVGG